MSITQLDMPVDLSEDKLRGMYETYYQGFPLISVLPKGVAPEVVAVKNSARIEIGIDVSESHSDGSRTLCVTSVLDNLIKGGAGQAMQNFNLMTGHENNYQLGALGMWP
jgi:N-acetyl-gamma-glutamylphosphate reductase